MLEKRYDRAVSLSGFRVAAHHRLPACVTSVWKMSEHQKRIRERLELQVPVRVVCRETPDFEWMEVTRLQNVPRIHVEFIDKEWPL